MTHKDKAIIRRAIVLIQTHILNKNEEDKTWTPIQYIQIYVAEYYNITLESIVGRKRDAKIVKARQIAIYLCRMLLLPSFPILDEKFNMASGSAHYAFKKVCKLITQNIDFNNEVSHLFQLIQAKLK